MNPITASTLGIPVSGVNPLSLDRSIIPKLRISLSGADKLITAYSVPGDILSQGINRFYAAPGTDGSQVVLPSPGSLPLLINRHSMKDVISSIQRALAQNACN